MNKIAIQGHPTRGKEVIQILESLGGINSLALLGTNSCRYYCIYDDKCIITIDYDIKYKIYTLEEFEKEFPFKIGDKVITPLGHVGKIINIENNKYEVFFKIDSALISPKRLKLYKEMKEERNITLTLNKAKEWYKKGEELKEVALQAYSKEELTEVELPKTWEEFCKNYPVKAGESWIGAQGFVNVCKTDLYERQCKNWIPSKKSAEAHLALIQLEQLRDCYRQGDVPNFNNNDDKYCIFKVGNSIAVRNVFHTNYFLSFNKKEVAEEFLINFEPLIKIAEDYI